MDTSRNSSRPPPGRLQHIRSHECVWISEAQNGSCFDAAVMLQIEAMLRDLFVCELAKRFGLRAGTSGLRGHELSILFFSRSNESRCDLGRLLTRLRHDDLHTKSLV